MKIVFIGSHLRGAIVAAAFSKSQNNHFINELTRNVHFFLPVPPFITHAVLEIGPLSCARCLLYALRPP